MIKDLKEVIKFLERKYPEYKIRWYENDGTNILTMQGWENIKKRDHPEIYYDIGSFLKKKKLFYCLSPILRSWIIPITGLVFAAISLYFLIN